MIKSLLFHTGHDFHHVSLSHWLLLQLVSFPLPLFFSPLGLDIFPNNHILLIFFFENLEFYLHTIMLHLLGISVVHRVQTMFLARRIKSQILMHLTGEWDCFLGDLDG
jgi:hypothetical protein